MNIKNTTHLLKDSQTFLIGLWIQFTNTNQIQQKFSALCQKEMSFHPLLPSNFYLCFWCATEKLGLSYDERCLLIPLFNRFVMDRFGEVLSAAHQTLIDEGIENYADISSEPPSTESS